MNLGQMLGVAAAGLGAGVLNTVVGSGTLLTFPVLLAVGVPPVQANIANNIGLAPGSISGAISYRSELSGPRWRVIACCTAAAAGGAMGAWLLLFLPARTFEAIVPVLILLAVLLLAIQPLVSRWSRRERDSRHGQVPRREILLIVSVLLASLYGGYFGAAQGVILIAVMSLLIKQRLQSINALKNVLQGVDNGVSALILTFASHVDWLIVGLLATGSVVGGKVGALVGRRVPDLWFRVVIVIVGVLGLVVFIRG
ncbi:hypothetical protein DMH01_38180 [Amycolatopsis sp. WAC 04182]|uniref:sulfite exporter TauE/SafE family protein n=1 Tax=Amycolatopsis sp. WAC 04182 TaxID=2203198 RepID=UPI000F776C8C|nr:sulfite exporter TauE/SafE family protein [Amycolatopsis sp. WAC 04182]RSN53540.1 hypothetical protein DMH01_38180 [Amycolatopsis sp. WAC 04182]